MTIISELSKTREQDSLIRLNRSPLTKEYLDGFVVGESELFVMLHVLDHDVYLNGYSVVRAADIRRWRVFDDYDSFFNKALRYKGICPVSLRISLKSFPDLFLSAGSLFPLITITRERISDELCYIGKVTKTTAKTVTLLEIDPSAKWDKLHRFIFKDITRVDFGGEYEKALALLAESDVKKKRGKR